MRVKVKGELVSFQSDSGLKLDGIFYDANSPDTIIHVHGSLGNFYANYFIKVMAEVFLRNNINFLTFNTSCHDGISEGFRGQTDFEYVGGSIARFDTCVDDIQGAINFVSLTSDNIILQGHSLGCDRIIHYMNTKGIAYRTILLSPCDSYQLQEKWLSPVTVENQIKRLTALPEINKIELLNDSEYGVKQGNEDYKIPITRNALLSIIDGPPFKNLRLSAPIELYIDSECLIYLGGNDALQTWPTETMAQFLSKSFRNVKLLIVENGDHDLKCCELDVANSIALWSKER